MEEFVTRNDFLTKCDRFRAGRTARAQALHIALAMEDKIAFCNTIGVKRAGAERTTKAFRMKLIPTNVNRVPTQWLLATRADIVPNFPKMAQFSNGKVFLNNNLVGEGEHKIVTL
jgi:hypothetical protein